MPQPSPSSMVQLRRPLEKVTRWRNRVSDNSEDAEGKKELGKAEKKWAKEMARCLVKGVQPEEMKGVKEEGDAKEEEPEVEVDPEEDAKEEAQGSGDDK